MSWQASNTLREFAWGRHSLFLSRYFCFFFFRIPDFFCQISSFWRVCCVVEQTKAEQTEFENRDEGRWHASLFLYLPSVSFFLSIIVSPGYLLYLVRISSVFCVSYSLLQCSLKRESLLAEFPASVLMCLQDLLWYKSHSGRRETHTGRRHSNGGLTLIGCLEVVVDKNFS